MKRRLIGICRCVYETSEDVFDANTEFGDDIASFEEETCFGVDCVAKVSDFFADANVLLDVCETIEPANGIP